MRRSRIRACGQERKGRNDGAQMQFPSRSGDVVRL
jgi:hypothetical protein